MKDYELKQPRINKTKTVDGKHFMWYDIYLSMTNEELQNYITFCDTLHETSGKNHYRAKKIICITTNEVSNTAVNKESLKSKLRSALLSREQSNTYSKFNNDQDSGLFSIINAMNAIAAE